MIIGATPTSKPQITNTLKGMALRGRAIRFSENVVADIGEWTSTWGRRALDFGGRAGYHDFNQI
jgi:hypothetical protein